MKWDVLMKVEGWVKVGEVEAADREAAFQAVKGSAPTAEIDESTAEPFEEHLYDELGRAGEYDVEKA